MPYLVPSLPRIGYPLVTIRLVAQNREIDLSKPPDKKTSDSPTSRSQFGEEQMEGSWFHRAVSEGVRYFKGDTGTSIRVIPTLDIGEGATPEPTRPPAKPSAKRASAHAFAPKEGPMFNTAINEFLDGGSEASQPRHRSHHQHLRIRPPESFESRAVHYFRLFVRVTVLCALAACIVAGIWFYKYSDTATKLRNRPERATKTPVAEP